MASSIAPASSSKRQGRLANTGIKLPSLNAQAKSKATSRSTLKAKAPPKKKAATSSQRPANPASLLASTKKIFSKSVSNAKPKSKSSSLAKAAKISTYPTKKVPLKKMKRVLVPRSGVAIEAEKEAGMSVSSCPSPDAQSDPILPQGSRISVAGAQDESIPLPKNADSTCASMSAGEKLPVSLRKLLCFEAKLAEQAERFDEMINFMSQVVYARRFDGRDLSSEERHLFAAAFKYAVHARRSEWRTLRAIRKKYAFEPSGDSDKICRQLETQVETELRTLCTTIIQQLTDILIPQADSIDHKVFYYKIQGDALRYITETAQGVLKLRASEDTRKAYAKGMEWADGGLPAAKPSRLGMALNFAVFHKELLDDTPGAIKVAVEAFDAAMDVVDNLDEKYYKDTSMLLQILRKNITAWKNEIYRDSPGFF